MFLFSSFSACGATHTKNDDRVLSPSYVLTGAENPEEETHFSEVVRVKTTQISSASSWKEGCEFSSLDPKTTAIGAVFDGVGGSARGNEAALAGASFLLEQKVQEKTLAEKLKECAEQVSKEQSAHPKREQGYSVCSGFQLCGFQYQKSPVPTNMSSSHENEILKPFYVCIPFNAGDSRTYHFSGKTAQPLSKDHTLANYKASLGIGYPASDCNVVTKFLGGENTYPFDIYKAFKLEPGDIIFSCSDGFWEYIPHSFLEQSLTELQNELMGLLVPFEEINACESADCKDDCASDINPVNTGEASSYAVPTNLTEIEEETATYTIDTDKALALFEAHVESLVRLAQENGSPDDISVLFSCYIPCEN
ncbi:MAG: PP2C family protein-serine/threonine phosphatase [Anaerotardibacter sp.]